MAHRELYGPKHPWSEKPLHGPKHSWSEKSLHEYSGHRVLKIETRHLLVYTLAKIM